MNRFEYNEDEYSNISEIVEKYEDSIRNNISLFLDSDSFEILIDFYAIRGELQNAMNAVDKALVQYPFSSSLLIKKAEILFENKVCNEALEYLDKAESIDHSEPDIFLIRAEIFTFLSRYQEAITLLENRIPISFDTDLADIYLQIANVYEDWEKYDQVFDSLQKCLQIDCGNEEALTRINYCMEITEEYEKSRILFESLIDEQPYSELAWYSLACAFRGLNKIDEAIDALGYVIAIEEDFSFAYKDLVELYLKKEAYKKALEVIKDYELRFEDDEYMFLTKGLCNENLGEYKLARYYYKKALYLDPNYSTAYFYIANSYKAEDCWDLAYTYYAKAADLEKQDYDYQFMAAETAQVLNNDDKAVEYAERCLSISSSRFDAYLLLAQLFLQIKDYHTALEIIDKGLAKCDSDIELKFARVAVIYVMGQKQEAYIQLMMLMTEAPGKEVFMLYMYPEIEDDPKIISIIND